MGGDSWDGPTVTNSALDRQAGTDGRLGRSPDRFAPLLRDLVAWGLVKQDDAGSWLLRDDVQTYLSDLQRGQADVQIYVGYRCQACGTQETTWASGGRHLCPSCITAEHSAHSSPG
jgi:hypothetical protein